MIGSKHPITVFLSPGDAAENCRKEVSEWKFASTRHPHSLTRNDFAELSTTEKPVCFNYHSYATDLQGILFGRQGFHRMTIEGYKEEGSTTTPFDMILVNGLSRYHVATRALKAAASY